MIGQHLVNIYGKFLRGRRSLRSCLQDVPVLELLPWPSLALDLQAIGQRIEQNHHRLTMQDGYTPQSRYGGLWSWPERGEDYLALQAKVPWLFQQEDLHLQLVKPPGIGFHQDRHRRVSAVCSLTPDHPTQFRLGDQVISRTIPQWHWALFDHQVPHAVLDLDHYRSAVCIDFTRSGLGFQDLFELLTNSKAGDVGQPWV